MEKRIEEGKVRVEKDTTKVVEEEGGVAGFEKEIEEVQDAIRAHRVEVETRERVTREEARAAREAQDVDMDEDGGDGMKRSDGEVGISVEEGKRRKVVRKGRFCVAFAAVVGDLNAEGLSCALRRLSDDDKARCTPNREDAARNAVWGGLTGRWGFSHA